jgi:Domain of unknown function (DUF4129)
VVSAAAAALMRPAGLVGWATAGPPVSRQTGQRLARDELSEAVFHPHPSLTQRILALADKVLDQLFKAGNSFPGGWWAVVALAALAALAAAVMLNRLGLLAGAHRADDRLLAGSQPLSAADHRLRAGRLAATGDYAGAIVECVRAIARELEERGVLSPRLGWTAAEIAAEAAQALPADASALRQGARLFDDICYGERPGTAAGYALVQDLDRRIIAASRKAAAGGPGSPAAPSGAATGDPA